MDNIFQDTRDFLYNVVGCYIEVNITCNIPNVIMVINKDMQYNNALCDNARCYTEHSVPSLQREYGIKLLLENFCKDIKIKNITFFIALGDFPILMKDKTKHPHYDRYKRTYNAYPKNLAKIFSRSIIPKLHEDLLFPTRDFIDVIFSKEKIINNTNHNFYQKKPIAVFRGSLTGNDRTITNTRVQARILSLQYPSYLDAHITQTFKYYMYEENIGCVYTLIDNKDIYEDNNKNIISGFEQGRNYKYILHIDGFVSAWRMAIEMFSMSVILKVNSDWIEHFYCDLIPWEHYIPIKSDLSDLIQIIEWCRNNDEICYNIAKNAYNYANDNFTKKKTFNYLENQLFNENIEIKEIKNMQKNSFEPILQDKPNPEFNFDITNIKYKRYLLPQNSSNKKTNLYFDDGYKIFKDIINKQDFEFLQKDINDIFTQKNIPKNVFISYENDNKIIKNIVNKINSQFKNYQFTIENTNYTLSSETIVKHSVFSSEMNYIIAIVCLDDFDNYYTINNDNIKIESGKIIIIEPNNKIKCLNKNKDTKELVLFLKSKLNIGFLIKDNQNFLNYDEALRFLVAEKINSVSYCETQKINFKIIKYKKIYREILKFNCDVISDIKNLDNNITIKYFKFENTNYYQEDKINCLYYEKYIIFEISDDILDNYIDKEYTFELTYLCYLLASHYRKKLVEQ